MAVEKMEFRTELRQLLHLITHALYSNREIFLRELISNASDAINKARFDSLDNAEKLGNDRDWKIRLILDKQNQTLTVSDNGIGMTRDSIIENLGTIAKSGTRAFLESLKQTKDMQAAAPDLIGQFGVGFYSAFMVADKVEVISRALGASEAEAVRWISDGQGEFSIEPTSKSQRGTDVILHLKPDAKEYLESWTIRPIVKKYSDFIEFPVILEYPQEKDGKTETVSETVNTQVALWLRPKSEIKPEEYQQFYQQLTNDREPPARVIHYGTEGNNEFKALCFIPKKRPFSYMWEEPKGVRLYIQRVLIMESCDGLLPPYLRFVSGLVDSADLPLNISRELLQSNPLLEKIQRNLVRNILDTLEEMRDNSPDEYAQFFHDFGAMLKDGISRDFQHRDRLAELLIYESTKTEKGKTTTLSQYVERMPADQKEIYYIVGESREWIENSPLLEAYKKKGWEVLLATEPIDEIALPALWKFKDKTFKAVDRADAAPSTEENPVDESGYKLLIDYLKTKIPEVADIRLSKRLTESASVLVADANALSAHYERLLARYDRLKEPTKRTLELNPTHPSVTALKTIFEQNPVDPRIEIYGRLLFEQAVITEGSQLPDLTGFTKRINELITRSAQV
jgi:molecular chaperone HtpG